MAATCLKHNIVRALKSFGISIQHGTIHVSEGTELTIRNVFTFLELEITDKNKQPLNILINFKELHPLVIVTIDILENFEDAIDINVEKFFDHDQEPYNNRIKKYYDKPQ